MSDHDRLVEAVRDRRAVLFVGAGVSMSVGLPSWQDLVDRMADELGLDALVRASATYQTLAEYYRIRHGSIGPLRSWMDRHWSVAPEAIAGSAIHELIVALDFPVIYTTNYDRNLEAAFRHHGRPFSKITTARDFSRAAGGTEIVKFHGDFDDDASLVLAESDYYDRIAFEAPLDVRLRSDAFGRTVLFIGYSMSDMNIRLLLYKLWQAWQRSGFSADRPPSFVFMNRADPVQEAVLGRWGVTLLCSGDPDPKAGLETFLRDLKQAVDAG